MKYIVIGISVIISLLLAEFLLTIAFNKREISNISAYPEEDTGIYDIVKFKEDNKRLYLGIEPHPHRWFSLPSNFKGQVIQTDDHGFRIDKRIKLNNVQDAINVGVFGGSTTFSVLTSYDGSIPYYLGVICNNSKVNFINYGVGGYSTSAELMTFIEVTRRKKIHYAIFMTE